MVANEANSFGNDVVRRLVFLPRDARKSWIDLETQLPGGLVYQFYLYVHDTLGAPVAVAVRLQVWRPPLQYNPKDTTTDFKDIPFLLVWEERVVVTTEYPDGALYTVSSHHN